MKLLIVAREIIASAMEAHFVARNSISFATGLGEYGLDLARNDGDDFDAIIVAEKLEDMSGIDVIRGIRKAGVKTPILFLAELPGEAGARDNLIEKAFGVGADDILALPCLGYRELFCRVDALTRRTSGRIDDTTLIGRLTINHHQQNFSNHEGKIIDFTRQQFAILEHLVSRKGTTVSKDRLFETLQASGHGEKDNSDTAIKGVDVCICKIRKKLDVALGAGMGAIYCTTQWGRGYMVPTFGEGAP